MSTYPSVLSVISDPAATDKLNDPSHSSIESAQNDAIKKLETFIGTSSSAVGTLMYNIRAAASDGGGHVQAANKGGTGQTAYTKGDVIIASSSSVLSKVAVGTNNQVLTADSNQDAGVKWAGVANATDIQNQTYTYARASVMSGSVYGVKLSENPSILSDGLGLVIKFPAVPTSSLMAIQLFTSSSGSVSALIKKTNLANPDTTDITASMIGVLKFDSVSSVFQLLNSRENVDLISNQSVVGIKQFTADPLIPDEAYGVGWDASLEPPTKNAVYDKVETIVPVFTGGQTSRLVASGTGTQNIAHGLGKTPKMVVIHYLAKETSASSETHGHGTATSVGGGSCSYHFFTVDTIGTTIQDASNIIHATSTSGPTDIVIADISAWDATNFTLDFTTMTGTGTAIYIQWEAFA